LTVYPSPDEDPLGPAPPPRRRGRLLFAVALVALVAASGLAGWLAFGPSGGVRGDGSVPLILADTQPYKFRPDDPGGYTAPNQDRMVLDRLHPDRQPQRTVERLLPPPEAPMSRPSPPAPPPEPPLPPQTAAPPIAATPPPPVEPAPPSSSLSPSAQRPAPGPLPDGSPQLPALPRPGVTVDPGAPQPPPPGTIPPQAAAAAPPAPPMGSFSARRSRLQLGSVGSEDAARSEWQRLSRRFPEALGDLSPSYVAARVGERTVVRLIAGPVDDIRALAICDELKSANAPCIIVRP
jgi:hypothetical protein